MVCRQSAAQQAAISRCTVLVADRRSKGEGPSTEHDWHMQLDSEVRGVNRQAAHAVVEGTGRQEVPVEVQAVTTNYSSDQLSSTPPIAPVAARTYCSIYDTAPV
jgi:hypothetical protein